MNSEPQKKPTGKNARGTGRGKAAAKTPPPQKKRPRKKKWGRGSVVLAFIAGTLITSAIFMALRLVPDFGLFVTDPGRLLTAPEPGAKKAPAPKPQSPVASVPRREQDKKTEREPGAGTELHTAVTAALKELQDLPYEEPLTESLSERVRQMDYAIMQAAWTLALPPGAMRLNEVADRRANGEPYRHQVIEVLPGDRTALFIQTLRECLAKWADGATVTGQGHDHWVLSVNGVATHKLVLYPGAGAFPAETDAPGRPLWQHSQPLTIQPRPGAEPALVIVIDDLGAGKAAVDSLLDLDYPVSLAFWPHAGYSARGARAAHAKGREILVHLPMEPLGYPTVKPGPNVLLTGMSAGRIRAITEAGIDAVPYATGLNNHMGSRFTQNAPGVRAVLDVLAARGLFMLDSLTHPRSVFGAQARHMGIIGYQRNVFLDVEQSKDKVLAALRKAEKIALIGGQAVAIGHPLPATLAALKDWQSLRNKKVRLVRLCDLQR